MVSVVARVTPPPAARFEVYGSSWISMWAIDPGSPAAPNMTVPAARGDAVPFWLNMTVTAARLLCKSLRSDSQWQSIAV